MLERGIHKLFSFLICLQSLESVKEAEQDFFSSYSLDCEEVRSTGTFNDERVSVCYHVSPLISWKGARAYCGNLPVRDGEAEARLPEYFHQDIVASFIPNTLEAGDELLKGLKKAKAKKFYIPLNLHVVVSNNGEWYYQWIQAASAFQMGNRYIEGDSLEKNKQNCNQSCVDVIKDLRGFLLINIAKATDPTYKPSINAFPSDQGPADISNGSSVQVFCIKTLNESVGCPKKQLYSPFWYNRYLGTTKGLKPAATVYYLRDIKISDFLFPQKKVAVYSLFKYNTTHPRGTLFEDHIERMTVYPFDLIKFDCSTHFHVITGIYSNNSWQTSSKTAICHANLTLTDEIRMRFCVPDEACIMEPCLNDGKCISFKNPNNANSLEDYYCKCKIPHFGKRCELLSCSLNNSEKVGEIWSVPPDVRQQKKKGYCLHGTCAGLTKRRCDCLDSAGPKCAFDVDDCKRTECQNEGVCVDQRLHSQCVCKDGFFGSDCSQTQTGCHGEPCKNEGECYNTVNGFKCYCIGTWFGETCEQTPANTRDSIGISLAAACGLVLFFTMCCTCMTSLRTKDRPYGHKVRMETDIALLFELAERKYGANNWAAQEKFVNYIYNETPVMRMVDAADPAD
ncbi:uncharacterized protein [Watersipora subatra]|uniref:uncharacterized protein n=1 Tax=Watersipora subatra TaxID=2589382 RepID=UPI00355B41CD